MGELEVGQEVKTKIAQYFDKDEQRCPGPGNATVTIPMGTIGKVSKLKNLPVFNTAQVYFPSFDMYVAFSITDLKPLRYKNNTKSRGKSELFTFGSLSVVVLKSCQLSPSRHLTLFIRFVYDSVSKETHSFYTPFSR